MQPLRYVINLTLDGYCNHDAVSPDEAIHRYWAEKLASAEALIFERVRVVPARAKLCDALPASVTRL